MIDESSNAPLSTEDILDLFEIAEVFIPQAFTLEMPDFDLAGPTEDTWTIGDPIVLCCYEDDDDDDDEPSVCVECAIEDADEIIREVGQKRFLSHHLATVIYRAVQLALSSSRPGLSDAPFDADNAN